MSQLNTEEQQVIYLIKTDADQARYFFARVKSLKWFNILKEQGYFSPESIPYDSEGQALFWNVLDYLERVSEQVTQNAQYGKELIDIIEALVQFSLNKKPVNNYHIWWYCVKIINNIPNSIITANLSTDDTLDGDKKKYGFRSWLITWIDPAFGGDLAVSDIGEKLLGKFLIDNNTIKYAEVIIDVITQILSGKKQHTPIGREDATLMWHSYWILSAFRKHYKDIGSKCANTTIFNIADKLRRALEYKQKDYYVNLEVKENVYRLEISRLPLEGLKEAEIGFKESSYECVLKQFTQEQLNNVDRENDFWALHNTKPAIELRRFIFNAARKDLFTAAVRANLPVEINWSGADKFEKKLGFLFDGLYEDYSQIWFKSLASSGSEHASGAAEVLTIILRSVLLAKCEANPVDGKVILTTFLSDKYAFPIFRRFVLLCIDKYWTSYSDLIGSFLDITPHVLEEADYEVELQDILYNHNRDFSSDLKLKLKKLIDDIPEYYLEKGEKLSAYWRYKWLSPLRDNPDFKDFYDNAKSKAQPKDNKPYEPERSSLKGGFVVHKSPLSKEEILSKPIAEIVKYFNDFQGADFWHGTFEGEPDKEGLSEAFQSAVKENPKRFTDEIVLFQKAPYSYVHRLLRGCKEAWGDNKELDWEKVFDFCFQYIGRDKDIFIKEALHAQGEDSGKGKYLWVIDDIVGLIESGSNDEARAFDAKYFDKVDRIFDLIFPLLKSEGQPDTQRDALTYALNTTFGRTAMTFVSFSLHIARVTQKKPIDWGNSKYERFLNKGIEGYIWFGCYLSQCRYLDQEYTDKKIQQLAERPLTDYEWRMFMEAYLKGSRVHKDLYYLMRPHYIKAVENKIFQEQVDENLVDHITIGYLHEYEALDEKNPSGQDSLFWKMLNGACTPEKQGRWIDTIGFFWSISGKTLKKEEKSSDKPTPEDFKNKILAFWAWIFKEQVFVMSKLGDQFNVFLGRMAELTIWLDKIDETSEQWLMLSAPHIELEHRSAFFIEYLTKFEDEASIKRISRIFLKVLENTTPTFRQEEIQLLIKRMYEVGNKFPEVKASADSICNTYGRRGIHFLKDIFHEYQKPGK